MIIKRWFLGTAAVFGLVLLLVLIMALSVPIVARWQLERQLGALFNEPATVEAVSINPFSGRVTLREVRIGNDIGLARLDMTLASAALFSRRVHIEQALLAGLQLPLVYTPHQLKIGKLLLPLAAGAAEAAPEGEAPLLRGWQIDELLLQDTRVALVYRDNAHLLTVSRGTIKQAASAFALPVGYDLDVAIDGNSLQALGEVSLAAPRLLTLQLQLAVDLADFNAYLPQPLAGRLALNQEISLQVSAESTALSATGSLQVDDLVVLDPQPLAIRRLDWAGLTSLVVPTGGSPKINASGLLKIGEMALKGSQPVTISQLDWSGSAAIWVHAATLPQIETKGLLLASAIVMAPFGTLGQLALRDLRFSESGLALADAQLTAVDALLRILPDGSIAGMPTRSPPPASAADKQTYAPGLPLQVQVDHVSLTGQLRIADESTQPQVNIVLQDLVLQAETLGQGQLGTFDLQGRHQAVNQTGMLRLQGSGYLLDQPLNAELQVVLSQFELHQLSPYLGNGIRSGRLQLDARVDIIDGLIAAENRVRIDGLKVDKGLADASGGGDLPLSLALDLLKDGDGRIDLKVPLKTDLFEFSVDTSDLVQTALLNAARRAAFAYVKQALQPLGTLLLIKGVAEAAARPRFKPLEFSPASATLAGDSLLYAAKIKDLLLGRPALTITLCGVATAVDKAAMLSAVAEPALEAGSAAASDMASVTPAPDLQPALLALAEARGAALTRQFVEWGVDVARLYACRASYVADQSVPRVDISL
jgi:hypothetical protein